jgi:hypothetical protein
VVTFGFGSYSQNPRIGGTTLFFAGQSIGKFTRA